MPLVLLALVHCTSVGEGVVRWGVTDCPSDPDSGACAAQASRVANTASPAPRPDATVLQCRAQLTGPTFDRRVALTFSARDRGGSTLTLEGSAAGAWIAPVAVGDEIPECRITVVEAGETLVGRCGAGCTARVTAVDEGSSTISGRIRCDLPSMQRALRVWRLRNAEGVPGDGADFAVAHCAGP
ncbi:MAG: hypothetical protein Q8Q09_15660 [Deltaproteobacteria bacterium]|nr:hypothetical protein [Deltaproteobacteria bacterium]